MGKLKSHTKTPVVLKNESLEDFFTRGREIARRLDQKKSFLRAGYSLPIRTISFEDM